MTLEELKQSKDIWVRPEDINGLLGCNAQAIREQAKANVLPFEFFLSGAKQHRVKIKRESFLNFIGG